jgi:hypothetical protein
LPGVDPRALTDAARDARVDAAQDLGRQAAALGDLAAHPWRSARRSDWSQAADDAARDALQRVARAVEEVLRRSADVAGRVGVPAPRGLTVARELSTLATSMGAAASGRAHVRVARVVGPRGALPRARRPRGLGAGGPRRALGADPVPAAARGLGRLVPDVGRGVLPVRVLRAVVPTAGGRPARAGPHRVGRGGSPPISRRLTPGPARIARSRPKRRRCGARWPARGRGTPPPSPTSTGGPGRSGASKRAGGSAGRASRRRSSRCATPTCRRTPAPRSPPTPTAWPMP